LMIIGSAPENYSDDLSTLNHVQEFLKLAIVDQEYLEFSLNPSLMDIRAFQWFTFENAAEIDMTLKVRYTGIIDLNKYQDFDEYLNLISKTRSRDYLSKASNLISQVNQITDIDVFIQMYKETFKHQGVVLDEKTIEKVLAIITSGVTNNFGELRLVRTIEGEVVSGAFFLMSKNARYYQFGASSELKNKFPGNSFLILEAIRDSFASKHDHFDISGLNSPNRGFFKASFGARPKSFFEIQLRRVSSQ